MQNYFDVRGDVAAMWNSAALRSVSNIKQRLRKDDTRRGGGVSETKREMSVFCLGVWVRLSPRLGVLFLCVVCIMCGFALNDYDEVATILAWLVFDRETCWCGAPTTIIDLIGTQHNEN